MGLIKSRLTFAYVQSSNRTPTTNQATLTLAVEITIVKTKGRGLPQYNFSLVPSLSYATGR